MEACRSGESAIAAEAFMNNAGQQPAPKIRMTSLRKVNRLKLEGDSPLKRVIVEAESNGAVRGYVDVTDGYLVREDGKLDVANALGMPYSS